MRGLRRFKYQKHNTAVKAKPMTKPITLLPTTAPTVTPEFSTLDGKAFTSVNNNVNNIQ